MVSPEEQLAWAKKKAPEAYALVADFFKESPQKVYSWWFTVNPLLGGVTPFQMIVIGRVEKLTRWVKSSIDENKT